ncbi:mobile mystery protein A [Vibrio sp. RC27]
MHLKGKHLQSSVKSTIQNQYQSIANSTVGSQLFRIPNEGWIRTVRTALGMSGAQLARRVGLSRNRISVLERREVSGDITLNQLKELADKLNCDLNYALVPRKTIEATIEERVESITQNILDTNSQSMFLEAQSLDEKAQKLLFDSVKEQIRLGGLHSLWNDK